MSRLLHVARLACCAAVLAAPLISGARAPTAGAEEPPSLLTVPEMADRAKILATEMRRGPASDLAPYLKREAHPTLRFLAIRALGRIGDRAGAPDRIRAGLEEGGVDLRQYLHAAGLSAAKALEQDVLPHATAKDPAVAADALEALGWIGGDAAVGALGRALHRGETQVVAAALDGLARAKAEALLERVVLMLNHREPDVRRAAAFAAWLLAGARRQATVADVADWKGDALLASAIHDVLKAGALEPLDLIRPLGILAPYPAVEAEMPTMPPDFVQRLELLAKDPSERVVQETVTRILAPRTGSAIGDLLGPVLTRPDPVTRQAALEALGADRLRPISSSVFQALRKAQSEEPDARVREAYAILLAKLEDRASVAAILARSDRPSDPTIRALTELRVRAASEGYPQGGLIDFALQHADRPAVLLEAFSLLEKHPDTPAARLIATAFSHEDRFVRAAAVGLVGKHRLVEHLPDLDALQQVPYTHAEGDVRQAIVEAWAELIKAEKVKGPPADELKQRIATAAASDPSFTARAAARDAMKALKIDGAPSEDPHQPNDWQGLPRPKAPLLGVDLTAGKGPLTEAEILTLADKMVEEGPEFVVETDVGAFRLRIDASEAPVHAVSFLLCVANGVYEGTPWHRVVPSFVIQGGDPHGTGNGDAGWHLPDEITRGRFVRGALGMPKGAIRDTGGCQLFVMHSDYRPLDGRYTCYGMVVDGMATVDKIRIGDRILRIGMVQAARPR